MTVVAKGATIAPAPPFPELDPRLFEASRYRFVALKLLTSRDSGYWMVARPGRWTTFQREELAKWAGLLPLDLWLEEVFSAEELYCEAWVLGRWVPASWWRMVELYRSSDAGNSCLTPTQQLAARIRDVRARHIGRKPALGELACHLTDHEGMMKSEAVETAKLAGDEVYEQYWSGQLKNGRKRIRDGKTCRFCE